MSARARITDMSARARITDMSARARITDMSAIDFWSQNTSGDCNTHHKIRSQKRPNTKPKETYLTLVYYYYNTHHMTHKQTFRLLIFEDANKHRFKASANLDSITAGS